MMQESLYVTRKDLTPHMDKTIANMFIHLLWMKVGKEGVLKNVQYMPSYYDFNKIWESIDQTVANKGSSVWQERTDMIKEVNEKLLANKDNLVYYRYMREKETFIDTGHKREYVHDDNHLAEKKKRRKKVIEGFENYFKEMR